MTFEQLHDLYFSQPEAKLDEQALRYFWNSAGAQEREVLVSGLGFLITTGHPEETNMDVALRQARNAGIREAQDAIRTRQP